MQDLVISTELRIFVLKGIKAMRALGNDAIEFNFAHGFKVLFSEDLEEILITHPSGSFSTAGLI